MEHTLQTIAEEAEGQHAEVTAPCTPEGDPLPSEI